MTATGYVNIAADRLGTLNKAVIGEVTEATVPSSELARLMKSRTNKGASQSPVALYTGRQRADDFLEMPSSRAAALKLALESWWSSPRRMRKGPSTAKRLSFSWCRRGRWRSGCA